VTDIGCDRAIRQPGRRPGEHEPGQHVGLELRHLLRARRRTPLMEIPHHRQAHHSLAFTIVLDHSTLPRTIHED
jgi:hypothetical protein